MGTGSVDFLNEKTYAPLFDLAAEPPSDPEDEKVPDSGSGRAYTAGLMLVPKIHPVLQGRKQQSPCNHRDKELGPIAASLVMTRVGQSL